MSDQILSGVFLLEVVLIDYRIDSRVTTQQHFVSPSLSTNTHAFAGEPSLCYVHEGDGVCEQFERRSSIEDCGLYTPEEYMDQWASEAYASHQDQKACPVSLVTGEPLVRVRGIFFSLHI